MNFDLLRNITIGQYLPTGSLIHRLDPRLKLLSFIVLIGVMTFTATYVGNLILLAVAVLLFPLARIPLRYGLSGIRPALWPIVILALLELLFYGGGIGQGGRILWHWGIINVTSAAVRLVVISTLRFVELIFVTSVLTFSTTTTELTHAIEALLSPFRAVRLPAHELALVATIALRFVPTFALEMERIMKAQASRGAEFGGRARLNILQQTRTVFPLIVPLFILGLNRAEDLIVAMESRGYLPGAHRTMYAEYRAGIKDYAFLAVTLLFALVMTTARFPY